MKRFKSNCLARGYALGQTVSIALGITCLQDRTAQSAACCAGSGTAPTIITSEDFAQLSVSASWGSIIGDAPGEGIPVFRSSATSEVTQTYVAAGALLISDLWQIGAMIPFVNHQITPGSGSETSSFGLGDLRLNATFEFLPEWNYSVWKPRGYAYLQVIFPSGASIYESQTPGAVDAIGKGFYGWGAGSLWIKRWALWDVYAIPEVHYAFARTFLTHTSDSLSVGPGWGGSLSVGLGLSPGSGNFRLGLRVQPLYEAPRDLTTDNAASQTHYQLSWNSALEAAYLVASDWTINATYTDQTLLGPAVSSSLSRSLAIALQHRWER